MGALEGLILGAIVSGISSSQFQKQLKKCLISETTEGVEAFIYKGEMYDREKFVLLEMDRLNAADYSDVKRAITAAEKKLEEGGEDIELTAARLSAYLRVLPQKKKPFFSMDDIL